MSLEPGDTTPKDATRAEVTGGMAHVGRVSLAENPVVAIARLEAGYTTTLRAQVARQLEEDPYVNLFSLSYLDSCTLRLPDNMTEYDFDGITHTLGAGQLRSLLSGAVSIPSDMSTLNYVKGERPGFEAKSKDELKNALEKLEKILAFLKALITVLNEKEQEYRKTENDDRLAPMNDRAAANRVAALDAVLNVLDEIGTDAVKKRMERFEEIAKAIAEYLGESSTPVANVAE